MAIVIDPEQRTATVCTAAGESSIGPDGELRFGASTPGLRIALARLFPCSS
jgi:hypothetical protein